LAGGEGSLGFLEEDLGTAVFEGEEFDGGGFVAVAGFGEEFGGKIDGLVYEAEGADDGLLAVNGGVGFVEGDVEGVVFIVFGDDDVGFVVGVGGYADAFTLPDGVVVKTAMLSDGFAVVVNDCAGVVGDAGTEEVIDVHFAEEADALAVLFVGDG